MHGVRLAYYTLLLLLLQLLRQAPGMGLPVPEVLWAIPIITA